MTDTPPALPPVPKRLQGRAVSAETGVPLLWIHSDVLEESRKKMSRAIGSRLCSACGEALGRYKCFVLSTEQALKRVTQQPPMHLDCAEFVAAAAPIAVPEDPDIANQLLLIWQTLDYAVVQRRTGIWVELHPATAVRFIMGGKPVTRTLCMAETSKALEPLVERVMQDDDPEKARDDLIMAAARLTVMMPPDP